jgi:hypothetical protein
MIEVRSTGKSPSSSSADESEKAVMACSVEILERASSYEARTRPSNVLYRLSSRGDSVVVGSDRHVWSSESRDSA